MRKLFISAITALGICALIGATPVHAIEALTIETQSALSVRLEQPKTPTNQTNFGIVFVALDLNNANTVTVTCNKKGPSDGAPVSFGGSQTFPNGGNTGTCAVDSSILSAAGIYTFSVEATSDSGTANDSVTVEYKTEGPGDPRDYSKSKPSACEYKIHFKTADDGGKTVKVEVYRSENTSFTADNNTRVATIAVGSNQERDFTQGVDCSKDFYYAVRAFDASGNGSGVVGDSETHTTVTTTGTTTTTTSTSTTVTTETQPAIEVLSADMGLGSVGEETGGAKEEGKALGEATPSGTGGVQGLQNATQGMISQIFKNPFVLAGVILLIVGAVLLYVSKKEETPKKKNK